MIRSMTGYGQAEAAGGSSRVRVTVRCANHRFADLRLRLPSEYAPWEAELRRAVLSRARRGRIEVEVTVERSPERAGAFALNRALLADVLEASRVLREELGIGGELDQRVVLSLPGMFILTPRPREADATERALVDVALDAALAELDAERRREGEALARDLAARLARVEEIARDLGERAAGLPGLVRRKLEEKVRSLDPQVSLDPARLAQEVLFAAERADVTEELVRLGSHLARARQLLDGSGDEPAGKRLDVLLQEIQREANTLASKSVELEMSRLAVDLKVEAEKVREQVQNVE